MPPRGVVDSDAALAIAWGWGESNPFDAMGLWLLLALLLMVDLILG